MKPALSPRHSRRSPARHWLRFAIVPVCALALGAPLTAGADSAAQTTLSPGLLDAAQAEPEQGFRVIIEGAAGSDAVAEHVRGVAGDDIRSFLTVPAVAGTLTGSQIVALTQGSEPLVITRDSPVAATDDPPRPEEPTPQGDKPTVAGDAEPGALAHRGAGDLERIRRSRILLPVGALRQRPALGGRARCRTDRPLVGRRVGRRRAGPGSRERRFRFGVHVRGLGGARRGRGRSNAGLALARARRQLHRFVGAGRRDPAVPGRERALRPVRRHVPDRPRTDVDRAGQ